MTVKVGLMICSILVGLISYSFSKTKSNCMKEDQIEFTEGAKRYQKNYSEFKYFIESIGTVSIDNVELNQGKLTAIYSYKQGQELRHVVSELMLDHDGIYKGTCTTKVNGKVLFAVNTWLTFAKDGSALGNWSWSGTPSKKDPIVKISKK